MTSISQAIGRLIVLLLISLIVLAVPRTSPGRTSEEQLSAAESRRVERFVREFERQLKITRNLTPFLNQIAVRAMFEKVLLDKEDPILPVNPDIISRANLVDLRQLGFAMWNFAYLSELYAYTKFDIIGKRFLELPREQQYPPNVVRLMKRSPAALRWWNSSDSNSSKPVARNLDELRAFTRTLGRCGDLMRAYFAAHPPERAVQYRKNIARISDHSKPFNIHICDGDEDCVGLPLHTKTVYVNIPVLTLGLAVLNDEVRLLLVGIIDD
jgi:hypothetical protein